MVTRIRELTESDWEQAWQLGSTAFGGDRTPPPVPSFDGATRWGAFDENGRLLAKTTDLHHEQWWGGRLLAASGIAGVAVIPEQRGQGAARDLLAHTLNTARERGAVVSALYCTRTRVYRALGFEACGVLRHSNLPTDALARATTPPGMQVRPGDGKDMPAIREVYDAIARSGNGLLSRRGALFPDPEGNALPDGLDGITLACDAAGAVQGYASWERGRGYLDEAVLTVLDLLATTPEAATALVSVLASWGPVTPTVRLRLLPWMDAVTAALPLERLREHRVDTWMHRPLDPAAAFAARGWPAGSTGSVTVRLVDPALGRDETVRLEIAGGEGRVEAIADPEADAGAPALDVRGWALLWCGAARAAQVRAAGLLTGDNASDPVLDLLLGSGGPSGFLDYF